MKRIGACLLATGLILTGCGQKGGNEAVTTEQTATEVTAVSTEQTVQTTVQPQSVTVNSYVNKLNLNTDNAIGSTSLKVSVNMDANDGFDKVNISYKGRSISVGDCYGYVLTAYHVHKKGRDFVYLHTIGDSDYNVLIVVDLNGDSLKEAGRLGGTGFAGKWSDNYENYITEFTNTEGFLLETRIDRLSTMTGVCAYNVDENTGLPIMQQPYYIIKGDYILTSKVDLEVSILPENKKETVPKGTRFKILRTDDKTFVDFLMNDGRECRINVGRKDWGTTINGRDEDEVFEGMAYAG